MDERPSTSSNKKRPLTESEMEYFLEYSSSSENNMDLDFSSDDSIEDRDYDPTVDSDSGESSVDDLSDSESNIPEDVVQNDTPAYIWSDVTGKKQKIFTFNCQSGISCQLEENATPFDCYKCFISDELLQLIVDETNRNANQVVNKGTHTRSSRICTWTPTNIDEMKIFFGLLMWMGLVKMPSISCYWSRNKKYKTCVASSCMSRNRFEGLLRFWHFSNNEEAPEGDRIFKIKKLTELLVNKYQENMKPGKILAVDETMIPFRGKLKFRQYIPGKRHKYGVKVFKLCDTIGYTYSLEIYSGKSTTKEIEIGLAADVVLRLSQNYLKEGRILVTDNYYTSLPLAHALLDKTTHTVGTLRKNRKGLPKEIISAKLKKGEITGKESQLGVVISKWKDKRDVLMLSTYHNLTITNTGKKDRKKEDIKKPISIIDYNNGKAGIDLSDQLSSYSTPVRKSIRWYHKVAAEFLFGTTVVNAFVLYRKLNPEKKKFTITKFREELVDSLLGLNKIDENEPQEGPSRKKNSQHYLKETTERDNRNRKIRKRCTRCYDKMTLQSGGKVAANLTKKVTTFCSGCPERPFICAECFNIHSKK